jgi:hypothetical protein
MVEAGLRPGTSLELADAVAAMRSFARDSSCTASAQLADGRSVTAVAIQREYLARAEAHLEKPFMPSWAPEVCREWRAVLDLLETDPTAAARSLDWAIKRELYADRAARRSLSWGESIPFWNAVLAKLLAALKRVLPDGRVWAAHADALLSSRSLVRDEVRRLQPLLAERGASWDELRPFLALREELLEIDTRFAQLDARGIFASLERAGALSHGVAGLDRIDEAADWPPKSGRARLRGAAVRRLAGHASRFLCDWQGISDSEGVFDLNISDPFAAEAPAWLDSALGRAGFDSSEYVSDLLMRSRP